MIKRYLDFEVHVSSDNEQLVIDLNGRPLAINLPQPIRLQLKSHIPGWDAMDLDPKGVSSMGHSLYEAIFVKEVESRFQAYLNRRELDEGVRLCIDAQSSELGQAVWEVLCNQLDPDANFLALDPRTPVIRITRIGEEVRLRKLRIPLRILVLLASPRQVEKIDPRKEKAAIETALGEAKNQGLVEIEYLGFDDPKNANFQALQKCLATKNTSFDIVHIIAHSVLDPGEGGRIGLVEPSDSKQEDVSASSLAEVFRSRGVMLVILQSCQSGKVDYSTQFFSGIAQQLIASGVPAVLAMQENIDQDVARHFIKILYERWLKDECLVEDALTQARQSVHQKFSDQASLWAIPMLYICPGVQLHPRKAAPGEIVSARLMDSALPRKTRVGKETELIVLIRLPDDTGLSEIIGSQPEYYEVAPDEVESSSVFDVAFPVDQNTGKPLSRLVEVVIESDDFWFDRSKDKNKFKVKKKTKIRPQGDGVLLYFPLIPKREGNARLYVKIIEMSEDEATLAEQRLTTEVHNGEGIIEEEYAIVGSEFVSSDSPKETRSESDESKQGPEKSPEGSDQLEVGGDLIVVIDEPIRDSVFIGGDYDNTLWRSDMSMNNPHVEDLIVKITRQVVESEAPEEIPLYDELVQDYFENPDPPDYEEQDDPLTFGIGESVVLVTPVAMAMVSEALTYIFKVLSDIVKQEETSLNLTNEQLEEIKEIARKVAMKHGVNKETASNMSLALVGALVLED